MCLSVCLWARACCICRMFVISWIMFAIHLCDFSDVFRVKWVSAGCIRTDLYNYIVWAALARCTHCHLAKIKPIYIQFQSIHAPTCLYIWSMLCTLCSDQTMREWARTNRICMLSSEWKPRMIHRVELWPLKINITIAWNMILMFFVNKKRSVCVCVASSDSGVIHSIEIADDLAKKNYYYFLSSIDNACLPPRW